MRHQSGKHARGTLVGDTTGMSMSGYEYAEDAKRGIPSRKEFAKCICLPRGITVPVYDGTDQYGGSRKIGQCNADHPNVAASDPTCPHRQQPRDKNAGLSDDAASDRTGPDRDPDWTGGVGSCGARSLSRQDHAVTSSTSGGARHADGTVSDIIERGRNQITENTNG